MAPMASSSKQDPQSSTLRSMFPNSAPLPTARANKAPSATPERQHEYHLQLHREHSRNPAQERPCSDRELAPVAITAHHILPEVTRLRGERE